MQGPQDPSSNAFRVLHPCLLDHVGDTAFRKRLNAIPVNHVDGRAGIERDSCAVFRIHGVFGP